MCIETEDRYRIGWLTILSLVILVGRSEWVSVWSQENHEPPSKPAAEFPIADEPFQTWVRTEPDAAENRFWDPAAGAWVTNSPTSDVPLPESFDGSEVRCVLHDRKGRLWLGTHVGLYLRDGERWRFFGGRRWLPSDSVEALCEDPSGRLWVKTGAGIGCLAERARTLSEMAAHFEQVTRARHVRHGFVAECYLDTPGDLSRWRPKVSDNDGLWTGMYLAAQSFRFAATGDPEALHACRESFAAMERLERITGISGFPARTFVEAKTPTSSGEWHETADGLWKWKGDTSSDEMVGHYFAYAVYHELAAPREDRKKIEALVRRVTDHILENGLDLIDVDGKPTEWGRWSERFFLTPQGMFERGLSSLEILSHLKVAHQLTGEERYERKYRELALERGYAKATVRWKIPGIRRRRHVDDQLAFLSYYPLLGHERDAALRDIYRKSLRRTYRIERPERNPLWAIIFSAVTGNAQDIEEAVETLRSFPLDLVEWDILNSHRKDIPRAPERSSRGEPLALEAFSPMERPVMKWSGNPYLLDGGAGGRKEEAGTFWLLPYWMARYHGFLEAANAH